LNRLPSSDSNLSRFRLLISDFGTCTASKGRTKLDPPIKRTGNTGTLEYVAPELLREKDGKFSEDFDIKCDIWSLGIILYAMAFSKLPFVNAANEGDKLVDEILNFRRVTFPASHNRSSTLLATINVLLSPRPKDRPTTTQILENNFIGNIYHASPEAPLLAPPGEVHHHKAKITRVDSVDSKLDNMGTQQAKQLTARRPSNTSPQTFASVFQAMQRGNLLIHWPNWLFQALTLLLLFLKLWLCLHSCFPVSPSDVHLYPIVLLSVLCLLIRESKVVSYQYLLAVLQWGWTIVCSYTNHVCSAPSHSPDVVMLSTGLCALSLLVFYCSHHLIIERK